MGRTEHPVSAFSKYDVVEFTSQADQSKVQSLLYLKVIHKIACFHQNGLITLYDADTHFPVRTFKAHNGGIAASCFHAKKKTLITQYVGEIKIWDLSNIRFNQSSMINLDLSVTNSMELLKKKNSLVVAGENRCPKKPAIFETMFMVDIDTKKVTAVWKDRSAILTTQKIRFGPGKHLIACGFADGYLKLFSCGKRFICVKGIRAHTDKITKLHVTRINNHPYCVSESDDKRIRLWNVNRSLQCLRTFTFPKKTLIAGTYYNHKVLMLMQEYGTQVIFVNLLKGNTFKRVDVGISTITRGISYGRQPKMVVVLDIAKLIYLGIKN